MVKPILGGTFEQLEQIPRQVVKQVAKLPVDIITTAVGQTVGSGDSSDAGQTKFDPLTGLEIPSQKKLARLKKKEAKTRKAAFPYVQQIIYGSQKSLPAEALAKAGQIPQYISGKPGFSAEKAIKRMQGLETEKKKLPPPVMAAKSKFSTAERRGGISG